MRRRELDHRGWSTTSPRRPARRLLVLLCVLPLFGGLFAATPPGAVRGDELSDAVAQQKALAVQIRAQKAKVAALATAQAQLKARMASTRKALAQVNADLAEVQSQVDSMVDDIATVQASYDDLVAKGIELQAKLDGVVAEERQKTIDLRDRKALLAERIRTAYDTDRASLLETLLSGASFSDVLAEVSYYIDIGQQDKALAEQIVRDQATLAAIHQTVVTTIADTNELQDETATQKADLDARLADLTVAQAQLAQLKKDTAKALALQKAAFAALAKNKDAVEKAIAASAAAEKKLQDKITELVNQQYKDGNIPSEYSGSLAWPMAGTITQPFGCTGFSWEPRDGNCAHFHHGIDIAAPKYTPIRAAGPGTVLFAGPNPYDPYPKAWIVIIAHAANLQTWYAHIDNAVHPPAVRAGDVVVMGQIIAYEGMTGRTTGPHLHWAVVLDGHFVNPRAFT